MTKLWIPRDWREPRDWKRPWRDPPGFFLPNCPCCPNCCDNIPTPLFATISSSCAQFNDTATLTWDAGTQQWSGTANNPFACGGNSVNWNLIITCNLTSCPTGGCQGLRLSYGVSVGAASAGSGTACAQSGCACDPMNLVFVTGTITDPIGICGCSPSTFTSTITVTE